MKMSRRRFLNLATGPASLPAVSPVATAQLPFAAAGTTYVTEPLQ